MWCTVGYFYIHTIRNALTATVATAAAAAEAATPLPFPFPPDFRGPLTHCRSRRCDNRPRRSIFCSFFHFPHPRRFFSFSITSSSCLLFLESPMTPRILLAPLSLDVHPADFISSYILHLLLTPSYRTPRSPPRHVFLGIFVTQLCHYSASSLNSHNSRNFCLSDTPPSFFRCRASTSEGFFRKHSRRSAPSMKRDFGR